MDFTKAKILQERYTGNRGVRNEFTDDLRSARGNPVRLAMMPVIVTNNKTVQHTNLRILGAVSEGSDVNVVRYVQVIQSTTKAVTPNFEWIYEKTLVCTVKSNIFYGYSVIFNYWNGVSMFTQ